jgi:uncharacterized membrane protein
MKYLEYLIASVLLIIIDGIWLSFVAKNIFAIQIKRIQSTEMKLKLTPAVLSYLFLVFGLNYFIIKSHKPPIEAAFLGWIIYFVFDFTNLAIFEKYSWITAMIDGLWGGVLYWLTTTITYMLMKSFNQRK